MGTTRRQLLVASAGAGAGSILATAVPTPIATSAVGHRSRRDPRQRTHVMLLGTKGGPQMVTDRFGPAQALIVDDRAYLVDCGEGVLHRLLQAGIDVATIPHLFLTHQHSDHNADFSSLLLLGWAHGRRIPIDLWGPPPLERMTEAFFDMNRYDIETRIADEGRVPLEPLVRPHELPSPGVVMQDDLVRVTAALAEHPPVSPAYAFRFDTPDRSVVFSGDTAPADAVIELARGADVLVHEVMYEPALDELLAKNPNAPSLREHLLASHTTTDQVGKIAEASGVRTLVLTHLVPGDPGFVRRSEWLRQPRRDFSGEVVLGEDLLVL